MTTNLQREKTNIVIEIDNLTKPQVLAIEHLMKMWEVTGSVGASRWTQFFSDGDGDFHPKIKINGEKPRWFTNPEKDYGIHKYRFDKEEAVGGWKIDYDQIAWLLDDYKEKDLME